jgi:hypothetical protein
MYANENKIDRLLDIANRNSDRLMDVDAKLAQISRKVEAISERLRIVDFRQWSASRAALGYSSPEWSKDFSRQFNFDYIEEHLADQPVPPKPKPPAATSVEDIPAEIAQSFSSRLAHPFAITCGRGWASLICRAIERMLALATTYKFPLGITQIAEMNGRLKIQVEAIGLRAHWAAELQRIADVAEACSMEICEVCGEEGALRQFGSTQKTRCLAHAVQATIDRRRLGATSRHSAPAKLIVVF